jgi:hypothetical protein
LKSGNGDENAGRKQDSLKSSRRQKAKSNSIKFISLYDKGDPFVQLFPYAVTKKLLEDPRIHSDDEEGPNQKVIVTRPKSLCNWLRHIFQETIAMEYQNTQSQSIDLDNYPSRQSILSQSNAETTAAIARGRNSFNTPSSSSSSQSAAETQDVDAINAAIV